VKRQALHPVFHGGRNLPHRLRISDSGFRADPGWTPELSGAQPSLLRFSCKKNASEMPGFLN
jgi:hypothetical protein